MLHPDTELRLVNDHIGYGIFATRRIPKGTITWVRDDLDQTFDPNELARFGPVYHPLLEKYSFVDCNGHYVLCWDLARFMNHSCESNCMGAGYEFELAIRDIEAGEELTDDYGTLNPRETFVCACGKPACRKVVQPDDFLHHWVNWDNQLRSAFQQLKSVAQPLEAFLKNKHEVEEAALDSAKMRSCRLNYCSPPRLPSMPPIDLQQVQMTG